MNVKLRAPISTSLAIAVGLIVLAGYFLPGQIINTLQLVFFRWAFALAAVAMSIGIFSLAQTHWKKISARRSHYFYSIVLLISLGFTVIVVGLFGPSHAYSMWIYENIQIPVESSLVAILSVILITSLAGLLQKRFNIYSILFIGTILVVLVGTTPILGIEIPFLHGQFGLRGLIVRVFATAGMRGLLIGIALGSIATGIRVLMGADRPYGG